MAKINEDFLDEFLSACFKNKHFFETVRGHLEYHLIPTESHKFVWKYLNEFYDVNEKIPSLGIVNQNFEGETDSKRKGAIMATLSKISKTYTNDLYDELIEMFTAFVKGQRFKDLYNSVADLAEEGEMEEAIETLARESQIINQFSVTGEYFDKVYEDFVERTIDRERRLEQPDQDRDKIPSGIHQLDYITRGGHKRGTLFCALGRSGSGKSTFLRYLAIHASRLGYKVHYFTCEGTKKDTLDAFDCAWTGTPLEEMETKGISEDRLEKIVRSLATIKNEGGEIYVHASERFDSLTLEECHRMLVDHVKAGGGADLILFDYLEIFNVEGKYSSDSGERRRREAIVNKMTNIGMELNAAVGTATQASDVSPDRYNNPDWCLTRSDISEFKGAIKPMAYFYTINQTDEEIEAQVARLKCDKFRFHMSGQVIKIATAFNVGRFYNSRRTIRDFWDTESNSQI